ncbi:MAG: rRNA pseudouridine synthase [Burkholderiales bacterium]|jgi:23S rRNA pseudouridine2605 synthase|nr:rRNA pseudouridine synthase [Burkholderiales bacterium]
MTGARKKRSPFRNPQPKVDPKAQTAPRGEARGEIRGQSQAPVAAEVAVKSTGQAPADMRGEKLHKMLAQAGLGSRRAMEERIRAGEVMVNGKVAGIGDRVTAEDHVKVGARIVRWPQQGQLPRVLLYHKPEGEIVSNDDPQGRPTVFSKLPPARGAKWLAIGRLDFNTSGLLIFTTSGDLANRMMHPRFEVEREYAVRVLGAINPASLDALRAGVQLEDGVARFEHLEEEGGDGANRWFRVLLREGRNRVVRRLFESQNLTVSRLMRVRFGIVALPPRLKRGQFIELESGDVEQLLAWASAPEQTEAPPMLPSATTEHSRPRRSSPPRS